MDEAEFEPMQSLEPDGSDVQVSAVKVSLGSGDEPTVVLPHQFVGTDGSEAVSAPTDFHVSKVPQSQCFLALADVRSVGAASKFALVVVQPFFFMIRCGLSFAQSVHSVAPEAPSQEILPKCRDGSGGVKHDCNQQ